MSIPTFKSVRTQIYGTHSPQVRCYSSYFELIIMSSCENNVIGVMARVYLMVFIHSFDLSKSIVDSGFICCADTLVQQ